MRKIKVNINEALADPTVVFAFQDSNKTRTVVKVRRTATGRPVVTFSDGAECRYTGQELVLIAVS